MLSPKTQYNLKNAKEYFEEHLCVGDYYSEGEHVSGQWIGNGASRLGLRGHVKRDEFLSLCENLHPQTGELLTQRQKTTRWMLDEKGEEREAANRRVFYDFTISPPKDVSILALVGADRHVEPEKLSADLCEVVRLRTSILRADDISAPQGKRRVAINPLHDDQRDADDEKEAAHLGIALRVRFAMRFGDDRAETDATGNRRETVRHAFNSPFWPFVLVTTSVGQEGLDFHRYCHRVIHWNLPSNPVDLEQREGRVHRYKGHAVRKNLSQRHRLEALRSSDPDLWRALFEAGADARKPGESELIPFWVYPGDAKIERCVPHLPMSREETRLPQLRRALMVYRMAFGHARQEDVIEHLLARVPADQHISLCEALRIDLGPP